MTLYLPCPLCGDDDTFQQKPSGPKPCGCCGVRFGVGRDSVGTFDLVEASTKRKRAPRCRPGKRGARKPSANTAKDASKNKRLPRAQREHLKQVAANRRRKR